MSKKGKFCLKSGEDRKKAFFCDTIWKMIRKSAQSDSQYCDSLCQSDSQLVQKWLAFCDATPSVSSPVYVCVCVFVYVCVSVCVCDKEKCYGYIYMCLFASICMYLRAYVLVMMINDNDSTFYIRPHIINISIPCDCDGCLCRFPCKSSQ